MSNEYFLLFKTAQAEQRCWDNFHSPHKTSITPIIELARGRKRPGAGKGLLEEELLDTPDIYNLQKNIDYLTSGFADSPHLILDITREPSLGCKELTDIRNSDNGYQSWCNFCADIKRQTSGDIIPTLQVNPSSNESSKTYIDNIKSQFSHFSSQYAAVAYRAAVIEDTGFLYDIKILKNDINGYIQAGQKFFIILDHEFIRTGMALLHAMRTKTIIERLREFTPEAHIIILSTSFPKYVTELGGEAKGTFRLEEEILYSELNQQVGGNIYYGDYGSINPVRNDNIGFMRGGWKPRIDFTTRDRHIFYYREKREKDDTYAQHYQSVAQKVLNDSRFDDEAIKESWGIQQILNAAKGQVASSSPNYWISVRMEIFLQRQMARLFSQQSGGGIPAPLWLR